VLADPTSTIFALASAPGRAGIAVVRLSGPATRRTLAALGVPPAPARRAVRAHFRDPASGEPLDDGLAIFFEGPRSYTGEDAGELHLHGSRAVVAAMLAALGNLPGLRLAEPGEFTRRAFDNGKLDLTAVEGVADLISAETAAQRRQALRQLDGALGRLYEGWRAALLRALAHLEAAIDFPEEELPAAIAEEVAATTARLAAEIAAHLADGHRGERLRDGVSVAIVGPPNVGKSSLLNALARREAAIVSALAGTTRDVVEVQLDIAGYPVVLADTAGLRAAGDAIEEEGIRRARARAAAADLRLVLVDARRAAADLAELDELIGANAMVVANKIDLARCDPPAGALGISVATGAGMGHLLDRLAHEVTARFAETGTPVITRARHRSALETALGSLGRAARAGLPELVAEDLRLALRSLGGITGRVDVEDLLDVIFRDFCIGK
jgi:tRNA modification GTPase